jgi:hypothetical protein
MRQRTQLIKSAAFHLQLSMVAALPVQDGMKDRAVTAHDDLPDRSAQNTLARCNRRDGAAVFRHACKMGLEGVVSKRLTVPYRSGPSRDWVKVKNPDSPAMQRAREGRW